MDALGQQLAKITRGCSEIISENELRKKLSQSLEKKTPLKIKAGFDPTAPDIHLGHTVLLRKLRQFQDLGHTILFLIGDFTARIGDPTGQNKARPSMSDEDVKKNAATYREQVFKVLDSARTETVFNNDWFSRMSVYDISELLHHGSVSQILAREDFQQRINKGRDVRLNEFMYPLLQAYDSVHLQADIEIGGTDQKFNLLLGRELQKDYGQEEQVVITLPLLEGLDGVNKMSKSLGNYIGINDSPDDIFGKVMSVSDILMYKYYELLTDEDMASTKSLHPKEAKEKLAMILISQYYSSEAAENAKANFRKVFTQKEIPDEIPAYSISGPLKIIDVLTKSGLVKSNNEARRLIQQQAVAFDNVVVQDPNLLINKPGTIKAGSRRFLKVVTQ